MNNLITNHKDNKNRKCGFMTQTYIVTPDDVIYFYTVGEAREWLRSDKFFENMCEGYKDDVEYNGGEDIIIELFAVKDYDNHDPYAEVWPIETCTLKDLIERHGGMKKMAKSFSDMVQKQRKVNNGLAKADDEDNQWLWNRQDLYSTIIPKIESATSELTRKMNRVRNYETYEDIDTDIDQLIYESIFKIEELLNTLKDDIDNQ